MSVSLLAALALAAGIFISRSRTPVTAEMDTDSEGGDTVQLEALRRAGI